MTRTQKLRNLTAFAYETAKGAMLEVRDTVTERTVLVPVEALLQRTGWPSFVRARADVLHHARQMADMQDVIAAIFDDPAKYGGTVVARGRVAPYRRRWALRLTARRALQMDGLELGLREKARPA